ncbi:MAG: hypothetical protein HY758_00950 [Nitrospirae bacterium]|nr:hypothetical protein [Nitrospirota bacterium]
MASLALAIVLWLFVVSKGRSVIGMDVPIGFKNVPPNLEIVEAPKTVSIDIEGQERILKKLRQDDVRVLLDLGSVKKGKSVLPLTSANIALPNTLTVIDISPQTAKLMIEEKIQKRVPVKPVIIGSPARGFSIKSVEVEPKTIEIKGPESAIAKIFAIKTEAVDITEITGNVQYRSYIDLSARNVNIDNPEVVVYITLKKGE